MWFSLLLVLIPTDPVESRQIPTSSQAVHINSDCSVVKVEKVLQMNGCYRVIKNFPVCKGSCYNTDGLDGIITVNEDSKATKTLSDSCQCCTPSSFTMEIVDFKCGYSKKKITLFLPKSCSCKRCSEGGASKPTVKRNQRKKRLF